MSRNPSKTAQIFLENLHSNSTQETISALARLLESLETKTDPDPTEIRLVQNIYEFLEKFHILEENIKSYSKENGKQMLGNKLASLYENIGVSGSIYRD